VLRALTFAVATCFDRRENVFTRRFGFQKTCHNIYMYFAVTEESEG
jgi:hypothetical protein